MVFQGVTQQPGGMVFFECEFGMGVNGSGHGDQFICQVVDAVEYRAAGCVPVVHLSASEIGKDYAVIELRWLQHLFIWQPAAGAFFGSSQQAHFWQPAAGAFFVSPQQVLLLAARRWRYSRVSIHRRGRHREL